jgi:hypothetical protein
MQRCRPTAPHVPENSTCRTAPKRRPTPEHAAPITGNELSSWGQSTMCIRTSTRLQVVTRKRRHRAPTPTPGSAGRRARPPYKPEGRKGAAAPHRRLLRIKGPATNNRLIALPLLLVIIIVASSGTTICLASSSSVICVCAILTWHAPDGQDSDLTRLKQRA